MEMLYVEIGVGKSNGVEFTPVSALVGSGAVYVMLPASLLTALGVEPQRKQRLDDGVEYDVGTARIAIDSQKWHCPVVFGPEDCYILGKLALEIFRLRIDSTGERLEPVEEILMVGAVAVE